jgi:hypothetical protein
MSDLERKEITISYFKKLQDWNRTELAELLNFSVTSLDRFLRKSFYFSFS